MNAMTTRLPGALPGADAGIETAGALYATAQILEAHLAAGRRIDAKMLREAMEGAFGATDASGAWIWKDAYDACEAALTLFLIRYGRALRSGRDAVALALAYEKIAALLPTHTRRSEESQALQQFSTPIAIAHLVATAAAVSDDDVVLEPSAGLGILPALAGVPDRRLILNEAADVRSLLLARLFPDAHVTSHDAAHINDLLGARERPSVVLMNPPFSVALNVEGASANAALRHIRSALARLEEGGRLVAITGANQSPYNARSREAFIALQAKSRVVFTHPIAGAAYASHGTSVETRITVFDKTAPADPHAFPAPHNGAADVSEVLQRLLAELPPRLGVVRAIAGPNLLPFLGFKTASVPTRAPAVPAFRRRADEPALPLAYTTHAWSSDDAAADAAAVYTPYRLQTIAIEGAREHPTALVQSVSMGSVAGPQPSYRPHLPEKVITQGLLSDVQLESVILAGEAHSEYLPGHWRVDETFDAVTAAGEEDPDAVQFRRGWFLGDGTGAGKGRQAAGVILDNWTQGRRRAVWISMSDKLIEDAKRDWSALGQEPLLITAQSRFAMGRPIDLGSGILFTTYATLRSQSRSGAGTRLQQLIDWLGRDFDGVIIFDESHAMANAMGSRGGDGGRPRAASQQGRVGLRLQAALASARVVYVSATGATEVSNLAYAERLGLWGGLGAPFPSREDFIAAIEEGEVAAMEVLARDLKSLGLYSARSLSYEGVEYALLVHDLTPAQVAIYDAYADAFQVIHHNLGAALEAMGVTRDGKTQNSMAKAAARSAFESCKQRFFSHLITAMKVPSLIRSIEADLAAGHAPVVQIVSTGEALMERRLAELPSSEWGDLCVDITPREYVLDYLANSFPTQLHEEFSTDEEDKVRTRPVFDEDGNPVHCQEALAARQAAIEALAMSAPVPGALDQIIQHFGCDVVAEVTGRSRRIVRDGHRLHVENRPASANYAEAAAFMDDRKQILVFSDAGGTGRSYHADRGVKNQRRRIHYLLEPGWRADRAVQGLGRTNRTNQAQPPLLRPVSTNVKGERRFISTIARRLDSLGAITKGQRQTGGQNLFRPEDNLDSPYARAALRQLYGLIVLGRIEGCALQTFEDATALSLTDENGLRDELPPISTFLNRILALRIDLQNLIFDAFEALLEARIEAAATAGLLDHGLETITGDTITVAKRTVIYEHPGAARPTELLIIDIRQPYAAMTLSEALELAAARGGLLLINSKSRRAAVQLPHRAIMEEDGSLKRRVLLVRPNERQPMTFPELGESNWSQARVEDFEAAWRAEAMATPAFKQRTIHMVSGLMLPIWRRLPREAPRVYRLTTNDGERIIGRQVETEWAQRAAVEMSPAPSDPQAVWKALLAGERSFDLTEGLGLRRSLVMNTHRVELTNAPYAALAPLKALGLYSEVISYKLRLFIPTTEQGDAILAKVLATYPVVPS